MKRKLIALGVISPLLLVICLTAMLLTAITGWLLSEPEQRARVLRIATVAPLMIPRRGETPEITGQPEMPVLPAETPVAAALSAPAEAVAPPPAVEEALGFALPAGSVNSVTHEGVATRLVIPKLGLDAPVMLSPIQGQTWQVDHLGQTVGHLEGTAPPGANSNIVLAGHVTLSAGVYGPFARLGELTAGDLVVVYQGDQEFQYVVDSQQTVDRTAVEVTYPSETGQLTLITCTNWNDVEGRYIERLIVKGRLVGG